MNTNFAREEVIDGGNQNVSILSNTSMTGYERLTNKRTIYRYIKRIIDVVLASIALVVLSPIFLIIALAIKLESKGPVFFKHTRIGKDGKIIKLYKFRSMVTNAEELIKAFTPEQMKEYKENYKLTNDPRITKVGKFLSVTPGLTGYWAANGRSCTTYEQRMQMELYYIDNLSLKMDVKVFFKTIEAVIKREGAI